MVGELQRKDSHGLQRKDSKLWSGDVGEEKTEEQVDDEGVLHRESVGGEVEAGGRWTNLPPGLLAPACDDRRVLLI